jgi:pyridoxamine 5'-phosphate oxidase family protein
MQSGSSVGVVGGSDRICEPYAVAMTSRIALTNTERGYVQSQPLGRLATVDAKGAPQNNPVGVFLDEETGDLVIGGGAMGASRKFRNIRANPQVALVIDDIVSADPWTVRGVEIRGTAVALSDVQPPVQFMSREVIRVAPNWIASWGLDPDVQGRQTRRGS